MAEGGHMICAQCQYPMPEDQCENPACSRDKGPEQVVLIEKAQEERKKRAIYLRQWKGLDYRRSMKRA